MLAVSSNHNLMLAAWDSADETVELPASINEGYFEKRGPMPLHYENRRSFHRYYMRGKAILRRGDMTLAVYTKDVSRQGFGFYSPMQLLPLEHVQLVLPDGSELELEVTRCRRVDTKCFDCGTRFVL